MPKYLKPFYGDVRLLGNNLYTPGGTTWGTGETEHHPITSWWWNGIPRDPGIGVVIGEPYAGYTSDFCRRSEEQDGCYFAETSSWLAAFESLPKKAAKVGLIRRIFSRRQVEPAKILVDRPIPERLIQMTGEGKYPEIFPFK